MKKKILILTGYYLPGFKGGGPIRSIKNIVDTMSEFFDFYIITNDRDLGDTKPYDNIVLNKWITINKEKVYYTNIRNLTYNKIRALVNKNIFDYIYLNSFFSYKFSIMLILLFKTGLITYIPIIIAPRGEFSPQVIKLKKKKKIFICFSKLLKLHDNVIWHATTNEEKDLIKNHFGNKQTISIAENIPSFNYLKRTYINKDKKEGNLRLVFISRIHPKKNLLFAINLLKNIKGNVIFDIYGPIEDSKYWGQCKKAINNLPNNIIASYKGCLEYNEVTKVFTLYHFFFFLTLGENYGHVIAEALSVGCPVILSDQTPWRDLELKGVGWDIDLLNEVKIINILQKCVDLDETSYNIISNNTFQYLDKNDPLSVIITRYLNLFSSHK